jgi:hypothetical protein
MTTPISALLRTHTIDVDQALEKSIEMAADILKYMRETLSGKGMGGSSPNLEPYLYSGKAQSGYTSVRHSWGSEINDEHVNMRWTQPGFQMIEDMQSAITNHLFARIISSDTPVPIIAAIFKTSGKKMIRDAILKKVIVYLQIGEYTKAIQECRSSVSDSINEKNSLDDIHTIRGKWRDGNMSVPMNEDGKWTEIVASAMDRLVQKAEIINRNAQSSVVKMSASDIEAPLINDTEKESTTTRKKMTR